MLDPRSLDADVEAIPHFALELRAELAAEESGDIVWFDRVNRRTRQILVDGLEIRLFAEDDIRGVLALIHAPVISGCEIPIDRTASPGELVQPRMYPFRFPSIGDALGPLPVRDAGEGVIGHSIIDAQLAQLAGKPVVPLKQICSRQGSHVGTRTWHKPRASSTK